MLEIISANLLEVDAQYIVHQANCRSHSAQGLAAKLFAKYPYANIYHPSFQRLPGNIIVSGNGKDQRYIINLLGQDYPGKPGGNLNDTAKAREVFFQQGLAKIAKLPNLHTLAFPHYIGCGLAGGDWQKYSKMIEQFANSHPQIKILICKLEKNKTIERNLNP